MPGFVARWLGRLAASLALAAPAAAAGLPDLGPDGPPVCYGRVYDASHMKTHPNQKIQRIFFFRGPDLVSRPTEEPPSMAGAPSSEYLATTVRGERIPKWVGTSCGQTDAGDGQGPKIRCGMACDRTLGYLTFGPSGELVLKGLPSTLYLEPDAEETLGKAEYGRQAFGSDDDSFRLDPQPVEVCKAELARVDPPNPALGALLRERLKPDRPFCFGRDYDPEHMRGHPGQLTTTIRIYRGPAQIANFAENHKADEWPAGVQLVTRVATRRDGKGVTQTLSCQPEADEWICSASDICENEPSTIFLRRDVNGGIALVNPKNGLPMLEACPKEGATASDDKIFRLGPMPLSQCGL